MPADQTEPPTVPAAGSGEEPTLPMGGAPAGIEPPPVTVPTATPTLAAPTLTAPPVAAPPPQPAPLRQPEKWAGRVAVPGAVAPGQKQVPAPTAPTQHMARYADPGGTATAPRAVAAPTRPRTRRRRSPIRRFFGAILALVLILAVPVVSAYVAYKLASGGNPFEWPPTVDYDQIFGPSNP